MGRSKKIKGRDLSHRSWDYSLRSVNRLFTKGLGDDDQLESYAGMDAEKRLEFESERVDRWKSWSQQQQQFFVETCGEAMNSLGYI